jgi:chromosomal replication initiator protein
LQYTEASRNGQTNDFLNFYQTVDVLIIDDIQEFGEGKKTSTQNTFFHIFNHLHQSGKQLILTCDKKPAELEGLEERLLNRFKWGLSAELESPDFATRKAILQQKAEKDGLKLPENIINYIAEHVTDNVRNLEGTIISLIAQSTLNQRTINLELAKKVVSNLVGESEEKQNIQSILDTVCQYFGVTSDQMQSSSRKREIVQARQIAMYFASKLTEETLTTIGTTIGKRNHATVLHACKTVSDLIDTDKHFRHSIEELEQKLNAL